MSRDVEITLSRILLQRGAKNRFIAGRDGRLTGFFLDEKIEQYFCMLMELFQKKMKKSMMLGGLQNWGSDVLEYARGQWRQALRLALDGERSWQWGSTGGHAKTKKKKHCGWVECRGI